MKVSFFVSSRNEQETLIHINKFPLDASHDHDHYRDYCTHPFLHLHKLCVMTAFTWSTSFIRLKNQSISTVYDQRTSQSVYLNLFNSLWMVQELQVTWTIYIQCIYKQSGRAHLDHHFYEEQTISNTSTCTLVMNR